MELLSIGKVLKAHGVKGELQLLIEDIYQDSFRSMPAIFLDLNGSKVPFLIVDRQDVGDNAWITHLNRIGSREMAADLSGQLVFVNKEDLPEEAFTRTERPGLTGFRIKSNRGVELIIKDVQEFPQQIMMICTNADDQEVLIPMVDSWISDIDESERTIFMDLPEGLL